ncbi:ExeA family protein [Amphritea sp.]|uniref:ExeA family protein n=1 Tax=Amphritea sp. TaxID=1872502 RepID=UPI0025BE8583|nr:ExeA family protein [Amphritea sp.]
MYNHYFGLTSSPFAIAPDPNYLYMSPQHRDALAHLIYGIQGNGGFVMLTGDIGTGKTTLCRCMLNHTSDKTDVAFILNPTLNSEELLASICDELHIDYDKHHLSIKLLSDSIYHHLLKSHAAGRNTVLIIDEAQNLNPNVLEQMRLLTNLETNEKKLLQIVMFGQPELRELIERPELKQLAQRITARFHLSPLKLAETQHYISHRMAVAGHKQVANRPDPIPNKLLAQIHHLSGGVPRLINIICDRALLGAYASNEPSINSDTLYQAASEVFGTSRKPLQPTKSYFRQVTAVLGVIFIALIMYRLYPIANHWLTESADQVMSDASVQPQIQQLQPESDTKQARTKSEIVTAETSEETNALRAPITRSEAAVNINQPNQTTTEQLSLVQATAKEVIVAPEIKIAPPSDLSLASTTQTIETTPIPKTEPSDSILENKTVITTSTETIAALGQDTLVATQTKQPVHDSMGNNTSEIQAYYTLFKIWQQDMPLNQDPCLFALSQGLRCLHKQGNWAQLNRNNRPALIRMLNTDGLISNRVLVQVNHNQGIASFSDGTQQWQTPLDQLSDSVLLNYTLLWNPPEGYYKLTRPGSSGPHVLWLKQQLARLSPLFQSEMNTYFDDQLVLYVKAFQRSQNLLQDGVVGPETLIRLNTLIDTDAPMLLSSREP